MIHGMLSHLSVFSAVAALLLLPDSCGGRVLRNKKSCVGTKKEIKQRQTTVNQHCCIINLREQEPKL